MAWNPYEEANGIDRTLTDDNPNLYGRKTRFSPIIDKVIHTIGDNSKTGSGIPSYPKPQQTGIASTPAIMQKGATPDVNLVNVEQNTTPDRIPIAATKGASIPTQAEMDANQKKWDAQPSKSMEERGLIRNPDGSNTWIRSPELEKAVEENYQRNIAMGNNGRGNNSLQNQYADYARQEAEAIGSRNIFKAKEFGLLKKSALEQIKMSEEEQGGIAKRGLEKSQQNYYDAHAKLYNAQSDPNVLLQKERLAGIAAQNKSKEDLNKQFNSDYNNMNLALTAKGEKQFQDTGDAEALHHAKTFNLLTRAGKADVVNDPLMPDMRYAIPSTVPDEYKASIRSMQEAIAKEKNPQTLAVYKNNLSALLKKMSDSGGAFYNINGTFMSGKTYKPVETNILGG